MNSKTFWQSKTFWLAVLQAVAGVIAVILTENPQLEMVGGVAILKSVIDTLLRGVTSKPLG